MDNEKITVARTAKVGGLIIITSVIINSIIFFIGESINAFNVQIMTIDGDLDFALAPVIFFTVTGLTFGTIGFYILSGVLNQSMERVRIIAIIVVLTSLMMPFDISGASGEFRGILLSMHIITGTIAVPAFTTPYLWNKV